MSVAVDLSGVPETLLWTLYHRAEEARRPDAVLDDPLAVALVSRIRYPFEERFGATGWRGRWQALRTLRFDVEVRRFVATRPHATVVALGEGLETQFWRLGDERVTWITVELPETAEVASRLLPAYGSGRGERERIAALTPAIQDVHALRLPRADDLAFGLVAPLLQRAIPSALPRIFALRFASSRQSHEERVGARP